MSTGAQAQELEEVPAKDILEQIENGEDIYLENVRITGEFNLSRKIVKNELTIKDSVFENDVDFYGTEFNKPLDFSDTEFSGKADFNCASFGSAAFFSGANFYGDAFFRNANFYGDAIIGIVPNSAHITSFNGAAFFSGANFYGDAIFFATRFDNYASFDNAKFNGNVYFNSVSFNGPVFLIGCDFKCMKVSWSSLKDALVFDGPTYVKLIKNFRELEQFDDADAAYFQYRRLSQANKEWSFSKLGDIFMWVSCGYGVKPHYTIGLGLVLILLFALIYWLGNGIRRLKDEDKDNRVSLGDAFYFSMVTFTTVGYGDWYPTDKYRKFVMIEGLLGWLTLALFLVTLASVMIRP
jgi:hypothetical protein